MPPPREEIIAAIRAVQNELERLDVKRERIQFWKISRDSELEEILESLREQLDRRKQFLGQKDEIR